MFIKNIFGLMVGNQKKVKILWKQWMDLNTRWLGFSYGFYFSVESSSL